jgi:GNAT superfamily N-acetyltransferase
VLDGLAVAGAWSHLHGTDCGVYAVGTHPDRRRRGIGGALVEHVLAEAQRSGARTASLQSTRMGRSLYAALGFTTVGRYEEWVAT